MAGGTRIGVTDAAVERDATLSSARGIPLPFNGFDVPLAKWISHERDRRIELRGRSDGPNAESGRLAPSDPSRRCRLAPARSARASTPGDAADPAAATMP